MASGNTLAILKPAHGIPPASNYATQDMRNIHPVLDFDAAAEESVYFESVWPSQYAGGGVTLDVYWMATSATSGNVKIGASVERDSEGNLDLDSDSFGSESTQTGTANGTSGKLTKTTLTITHANIGSPSSGEPYRLKIARKAADAADTMTGDMELLAIHVRET